MGRSDSVTLQTCRSDQNIFSRADKTSAVKKKAELIGNGNNNSNGNKMFRADIRSDIPEKNDRKGLRDPVGIGSKGMVFIFL